MPVINGVEGQLLVCYDSAKPSTNTILQSHLPLSEGRGPIQPISNYKVL